MISIIILILILFIINIVYKYTYNKNFDINEKTEIKYINVPNSLYDHQYMNIDIKDKYYKIFKGDFDENENSGNIVDTKYGTISEQGSLNII